MGKTRGHMSVLHQRSGVGSLVASALLTNTIVGVAGQRIRFHDVTVTSAGLSAGSDSKIYITAVFGAVIVLDRYATVRSDGSPDGGTPQRNRAHFPMGSYAEGEDGVTLTVAVFNVGPNDLGNIQTDLYYSLDKVG